MKKKVIGLNILLLVLLLGLSTTSYALSESQIENYVYNYWTIRMNKDSDATKSWIESNSSVWQTIANASETYNSFIFGEDINSSGRIYFFWNNNNANLYVYTNNQSRITSNTYNWYYFQIGINGQGQNYIYDYTSSTTYRISDMNANYSYSNRGLKSGSSGPVVYTADSVRPSTWLDGPYVDALGFTFIPASSSTYADVGDFEDIPFYSISGDDDLYIGQLVIPNEYEISYRTFSNFYWRYNNWQVRELGKVTYLEYFTTENNETLYDVYLYNKYAYANTIYSLYWTDDTQEPFALAGTNFYIANIYTSVVNGALDPNNTFSGDYKDQYDNDLQNQEDANNISEAIDDTILDDSEVDNMLSGFNTSGDILNSLGYSPVENPFTTVILDVITQLTDVLLGSGNVTLDISAFDLEMVLHSESFTLPNGIIKTFISLVSNGFMIWIIYKYGFKLYMEINTGKFKNLIDETTNTNINLF